MINFDTALSLLIDAAQPLGLETIFVHHALGRRLSKDYHSILDSPRFNNSQVDGYMVCTKDLISQQPPLRLPVIFETRAGNPVPAIPKSSTAGAGRTSTGAPIPEPFDAVVMQEVVKVEENSIILQSLPPAGSFVRYLGEDLQKGDLVASRGQKIDPGVLALLIEAGITAVEVYKKPKVALVVTGDELEKSSKLRDQLEKSSVQDYAEFADQAFQKNLAQIPDSNSPSIAAMLQGLGIDCQIFHAKDSQESVHSALHAALDCSDVLITLGGISVGDHDHIHQELESIGIQEIFWRVKVRPGRPTYFGASHKKSSSETKQKYVLGLPGNPVSAMTMMQTFGLALFSRLDGVSPADCAVTLSATLEGDLAEAENRLELVRGHLTARDGGLFVKPLLNRDSHLVTGFAGSNGLIVLPANQTLNWGSLVTVLPLSFAALSGLN